MKTLYPFTVEVAADGEGWEAKGSNQNPLTPCPWLRLGGFFYFMAYPIEFKDQIEKADADYQMSHGHLPKPKYYPKFGLNPVDNYIPPSYIFTIKDHGYIYFMEDMELHPGLIKVGFSKNWQSRLQSHRGYLPCPEVIAVAPGDRRLERHIHELWTDLAKFHAFGEWFKTDKSQIQNALNWHFCEYNPINYPVIFLK